jgi:hypothetical protein
MKNLAKISKNQMDIVGFMQTYLNLIALKNVPFARKI